MLNPITSQPVRAEWSVGNQLLEMAFALDADGWPALARLRLAGDVEFAPPPAPFGPTVAAGDAVYRPGAPGMTFAGGELIQAGGSQELRLNYVCGNGLRVCHHVSPSRDLAAWRSWTTLANPPVPDGSRLPPAPIERIRYWDAVRLAVGVSDAEPHAACLLGWLDGPRADAPGKPPVPHAYPSWIPRLLYGDGAPTPPEPPPGWATAPLRLVRERLTRLPLRSGKRSTYDNYPWVTVLDPGRQAGFFAGFEWSGQWKMDLEHDPAGGVARLCGGTDGNTHTLAPGQALVSPAAFVGLFRGDWDDGFNACRRYAREEVLAAAPAGPPGVHYFTGSVGWSALKDRAAWKTEIDAAADAGMDSFLIDAGWWEEGPLPGEDFSLGLGFFREDPRKFAAPAGAGTDGGGGFGPGLRAVSDYVHRKGMKFGLWFEFERVDIRTANRGRNPWKPEWLVHQRGHPYRSWRQHIFLLCLGVNAAAEWALENISWALREYGVDWLKIDGNEYAFCDDPAHDHGADDGDWAQTRGLYHVMRGLRERFPNLLIENCAGGSQRADFGMARYSHVLQTNDIMWPSTLVRQYSYGIGCAYPTSYGMQCLYPYPQSGTPGAPQPNGTGCSTERLEWRALSRMMGLFDPCLDYARMSEEDLAQLRGAVATYKRLRPTLDGDRYLLAPPPALVAPRHLETGQWEVCQHVSADRRLASVFFYRCLSDQAECRAVLRGLDPAARYRAEWHTGRPGGALTGAEWMTRGVVCRLDQPLHADILLLERQE
jgi:alpha-galactosidase